MINSYGNIGLKYQFKIHADYRILTNLIRNADTGKDSKELKTTRAYNEKYQMASIKETNKENKSICTKNIILICFLLIFIIIIKISFILEFKY